MKHLIFITCILSILTLPACKKSKPVNDGGGSLSGNKTITSFILKATNNPTLTADITGIITTDSVILYVPGDINIGVLKPTIVHNGTGITPVTDIVQDFTSTVNYTVTAEDNSTKNYAVVVRNTVKSTVYFAGNYGKVYALDGDNGALKWAFNTGTGGLMILASPTYYNGTVFIGSADANLYALDAATGNLKWKYLTHGSLMFSTPTLYNGVLYFTGENTAATAGYLYAVNAETGALVWEKTMPSVPANPTAYNNQIFVSNISGLASYNAFTGQKLLDFASNLIYADHAAVLNGILYTGSDTKFLTAYNTTTAAVIWYYNAPGNHNGAITCGPTVSNGTIYDATYDQMFAMDSVTGSIRWKYPLSSGIAKKFSAPSAANGMLYAGTTDSYFYAIDASTGQLRWKFGSPLPESNANNGTVVGNLVYFGSADKNIYALNAFNGSIRWKYETDAAVYSGPCVVTENQVVYHPGISGEHQ